MKNNNLMAFCLFVLILMGVLYGMRDTIISHIIDRYSNKSDTVIVTKTDTLWRDTTITKTDIKLKYLKVVQTDTVYDKQGNEIELVTDNKTYQDTILCGQDTINYQIHISGIKSRLDSINLRLKKSEVIKTNTIEVTKYLERNKTLWNRFHIQPQATSGYDVINKKWGIMIGIGVGVDL